MSAMTQRRYGRRGSSVAAALRTADQIQCGLSKLSLGACGVGRDVDLKPESHISIIEKRIAWANRQMLVQSTLR
jgi:hypothetical protein